MKNDQSYPGEDGARGNCGKSRLFWKAQIVCVSVCERENESERERWGEMGRNTGEFRSDSQCMKVKSEGPQPCSTLSNPMDCSLPGSAIHGIFQTRVLEWGAIAFSTLSMILAQVTLLFKLVFKLCF